jgi:hypothetical protein
VDGQAAQCEGNGRVRWTGGWRDAAAGVPSSGGGSSAKLELGIGREEGGGGG